MSDSTSTVEYREIQGFANYFVSNDGVVIFKRKKIGVNSGKGYVLHVRKQKTDRYGYKQVGLCLGGKVFWRPVHRLVLIAFVGPCPEGKQCCHNNGVMSDNRVENLRWGTIKENAQDRERHGFYQGSKKYNARLKESDIPKIRKLLSDGVTHNAIALMFGVTRGPIGSISQGRSWKHVP